MSSPVLLRAPRWEPQGKAGSPLTPSEGGDGTAAPSPRLLQMSGCGAGRSWSSALHRVTPLPSSHYLCFPCKVWGFSKQTGGDKHMLWTALYWVVSEVQQSRSLSGCGYTSHSEVDDRTGALLLPHQ